MNLEQKKKLLTLLCERQESTSLLELRIGGVSGSGYVIDDIVTILKCAPAVFDLLVEFKKSEKAEGRSIYIDADHGGITIS